MQSCYNILFNLSSFQQESLKYRNKQEKEISRKIKVDTTYERAQMLNFRDKNFKAAFVNMFIGLRKLGLKK